MKHAAPTRAHRKLARIASKRSQNQIAAELQVGQQTISQILLGRRRPREHVRHAMERLYAIPREDWYTPAERRIALGAGAH